MYFCQLYLTKMKIIYTFLFLFTFTLNCTLAQYDDNSASEDTTLTKSTLYNQNAKQRNDSINRIMDEIKESTSLRSDSPTVIKMLSPSQSVTSNEPTPSSNIFKQHTQKFIFIAIAIIIFIFFIILFYPLPLLLKLYANGFYFSPEKIASNKWKKIPADEIVYILKISRKENLKIELDDILEIYTKAPESEKLSDILGILKNEPNFLTDKDLKDIFIEKVKYQKLFHYLIKARKIGTDITVKHLIDLIASNIDVYNFIDNAIKAKRAGFDITVKEFKDLYLNRVDVDKFIDLAVQLKKSGLAFTIEELKYVFLSSTDAELMMQTLRNLYDNGIRIPLNLISDLPLTAANASKFTNFITEIKLASDREFSNQFAILFAEKKKSSYDELKKQLHNQKFAIDSLSNAFLLYGKRGIERAVRDKFPELSLIDAEQLIDAMLKSNGIAYKITFPEVREFFLAKDWDDSLVSTFKYAKENRIDVSFRVLQDLAKAGIDVQKMVTNPKLNSSNYSKINFRDLDKNNTIKKTPEKFIKVFLDLKENNIEVTPEDIDKLTMYSIDIEKFAIKLIDANKLFSLKIKDIISLRYDKFDVIKFIDALIVSHNKGVTLNSLKNILLAKVDVEIIINAYLLLFDKAYSVDIVEIERIALAKINVLKFVESFSLLLDNKINISFSELKLLALQGVNIQKFVGNVIKLSESDRTIMLSNFLSISDIEKIVSINSANNLLRIDYLISFQKRVINISNVVVAYNIIKTKKEIEFETVANLEAAKFDVIKLAKQAITPEFHQVYPIAAVSSDIQQYYFHIKVGLLINLNKYFYGYSQEKTLNKIKESFVVEVNRFSSQQLNVTKFSEIEKNVLSKAKKEISPDSSFEVVDLLIVDFTSEKSNSKKNKVTLPEIFEQDENQ